MSESTKRGLGWLFPTLFSVGVILALVLLKMLLWHWRDGTALESRLPGIKRFRAQVAFMWWWLSWPAAGRFIF